MPLTTDYLVIGSGVAGLTFALEASVHGDVLLVTKRSADESNTKYAQGGVAAVLSAEDSFEAHIADTLEAGAGLCHERAVEICVREGPARACGTCRPSARDSTARRARRTTPISTFTSREATARGGSHTQRT